MIVQNENTLDFAGHCVEAHDLAASKLVAFREKDRAFARILLVERLVETTTLIERIRALPRPREEKERLVRWVDATGKDLRILS